MQTLSPLFANVRIDRELTGLSSASFIDVATSSIGGLVLHIATVPFIPAGNSNSTAFFP
jgi:hypothetical protein